MPKIGKVRPRITVRESTDFERAVDELLDEIDGRPELEGDAEEQLTDYQAWAKDLMVLAECCRVADTLERLGNCELRR